MTTGLWASANLSKLGFKQEVIPLGVVLIAFKARFGVQVGVVLRVGAQHLP